MRRISLTRALAGLTALLMLMAPLALAEQAMTPESLLAQMTLRQKVGQLFLIRPEHLSLNSEKKRTGGGHTAVNDAMRRAYADYPVGGFVLFAGNISDPKQLKAFTRDLKSLGSIPSIVSVDEEGGRVLRVASNEKFKIRKMVSMSEVGKTGDPENARKVGGYLGNYLREYGFNLDLAPVTDVRSNPKNSVIGNRAFSSDPQLVSRMVASFIEGIHGQRVRTCLKHFPGHGGTAGDTHAGYVALEKTWDELLQLELIPFIDNLAAADVIMLGHISLPNVTDDGLPASLSKQIITDRLRGELGYQGLVTTDALEMGAITKTYTSAEAAVLALDAGVDLLMMPAYLPGAFDGVVEAVQDGRIPEARLDESVLRILRMKMNQ